MAEKQVLLYLLDFLITERYQYETRMGQIILNKTFA